MTRWFLAALILWAGAALGSEPWPRYALGLSLPGMGQVSGWRVQEGSAWGADIRSQWAETRWDAAGDEPRLMEEVESRRRLLSLGVHHLRFRPSPHDVRSFMSFGIDGYFLSSTHEDDIKTRYRDTWTMTASTGVGVSWQPFERVGMWIRQGALAISYHISRRPSDPNLARLELQVGVGVGSPSVIAFFLI